MASVSCWTSEGTRSGSAANCGAASVASRECHCVTRASTKLVRGPDHGEDHLHHTAGRNREVFSATSVEHFVLEQPQDECCAGDITDFAGASSDVPGVRQRQVSRAKSRLRASGRSGWGAAGLVANVPLGDALVPLLEGPQPAGS